MTLYQTHGANLITEIGTLSQRERLQAGVLPEQEFDAIVRDHLFAALGLWPRFKKIKYEVIQDLAILRGKANTQDRVTFETVSADEITAAEWADLKKLQEFFPKAQEISVFWVVATCGEFMQKFTKVRITIDYYGRFFQQEVKVG